MKTTIHHYRCDNEGCPSTLTGAGKFAQTLEDSGWWMVSSPIDEYHFCSKKCMEKWKELLVDDGRANILRTTHFKRRIIG